MPWFFCAWQALEQAKETAKAELADYKDPADYREAQREELASAVKAGREAIDAAADETAVEEALAAAKAVLDGVKTDAQLTEEEASRPTTPSTDTPPTEPSAEPTEPSDKPTEPTDGPTEPSSAEPSANPLRSLPHRQGRSRLAAPVRLPHRGRAFLLSRDRGRRASRADRGTAPGGRRPGAA